MPALNGKWTWQHVGQANGEVVAVMLTKSNQTIAVTFPRPEGWTGEGKRDEDHIRSILLSAIQERWSGAPSTP
jgi:hypothetical protein